MIGRRDLAARLQKVENELLHLEQRIPSLAREVRSLRTALEVPEGGEASGQGGESEHGDAGDDPASV